MSYKQLIAFKFFFTGLFVVGGLFAGANLAGFVMTHNALHLVLAAIFLVLMYFVKGIIDQASSSIEAIKVTESRLQQWKKQ
jgi:hypothetical protein